MGNSCDLAKNEIQIADGTCYPCHTCEEPNTAGDKCVQKANYATCIGPIAVDVVKCPIDSIKTSWGNCEPCHPGTTPDTI